MKRPLQQFPITTKEMLKCPFCGHADLQTMSDLHHCWVQCKSCGTTGPDTLAPEEAERLWNHRVTHVQGWGVEQ